MCKKLFTVLLFLFTIQVSFGQVIFSELYKASTIPDSLKEGANAIVRYNKNENIIKGSDKIINKIHCIVTVLNEKADNEGLKILYYDKSISITSFHMKVYNAEGILVKKYNKSDMYDGSVSGDGSLITDNRFKGIKHTIASYPSTIEVIYETDRDGSLGYGSWYLREEDKAMQYSYCSFLVSPSAGLRFKNVNTNILPKKSTVDNMDFYEWEVRDLKAIKADEGTPEWRVIPRVDFSGINFQYEGIPGNMSTWQNFGKWIQALNSEVNTLPLARAEEFRKMTAHLPSDKEKAKFLYEYMQKNMRYVSIQLGIGGLKPFQASFVDQKKYGDCKALSNYMYAMLKAVGIPSNYAVINAGYNAEPADPKFSQNRFNHAILCIPFKNDTTWLECTSTTQPFGQLGPFTENRNALLITDEGGKLVCTPKSKAADNTFKSEVNIKLFPNAAAQAKVHFTATGSFRSIYLSNAEEKIDEQKEYFLRSMKMKQPVYFDLKQGEDKGGEKELYMELDYDKFCEVSAGDKQFYRPRIFDLVTNKLSPQDNRKHDYYFKFPSNNQCTTTIELPEGFEVETMPANQTLKFTYGDYAIDYKYDASKNHVVSTAHFNLNQHVIPAEKYTEMQQFMDAVIKAQNKKLVIRRKA